MRKKYNLKGEFNNFDWSLLQEIKTDRGTQAVNYTFGKGGIGHPGGANWNITIYGEDEAEVWEFPDALSRLIDNMEKNGGNQVRREFRNLLQIE